MHGGLWALRNIMGAWHTQIEIHNHSNCSHFVFVLEKANLVFKNKNKVDVKTVKVVVLKKRRSKTRMAIDGVIPGKRDS